jgi:hypothetical protein
VADRGEAVYTLQVLDDPAQPNPGAAGTLEGNTGAYTLDFYYIIRFGNAPYTVDVDFDWGGTFNDGVAGRVTLGAEVEAASGANSALNEPVPAAMPDGPYLMAVRVTDSTAPVDGGPQVATFVWPGVVNLVPQSIFQDNMESYANTAAALTAGWARGVGPNNFGSTQWYLGTQYSTSFNAYFNKMWHSNQGADGSDGNSTSNGDQHRAVLRTPSLNFGGAGTKTLFFRTRIEYQESTSFDRFYNGVSPTATTFTSTDASLWPNLAIYGTGVVQSSLQTRDLSALTGTQHVMWSNYTDDGAFNAHSGPHLDAVAVMPSAAPPAGW